ncbi:MAG: hypothetical protein RIT40_122, partial [Planctomycetota bacterium]
LVRELETHHLGKKTEEGYLAD